MKAVDTWVCGCVHGWTAHSWFRGGMAGVCSGAPRWLPPLPWCSPGPPPPLPATVDPHAEPPPGGDSPKPPMSPHDVRAFWARATAWAHTVTALDSAICKLSGHRWAGGGAGWLDTYAGRDGIFPFRDLNVVDN